MSDPRARGLIVFARAPVPGACKTRLVPRYGARGAARIHRLLARRTLAIAATVPAALELWCAPDARHGFFRECRRVYAATLHRQRGADLGARMAAALGSALRRGAGTAVIVGTDCAALGAPDIDAAFAALEAGSDYVLQPARDGGFVLIGARVDDPAVLRGIEWSSGRECAQTLDRITRAGHRCALLAESWDVDSPADWRRARREDLA